MRPGGILPKPGGIRGCCAWHWAFCVFGARQSLPHPWLQLCPVCVGSWQCGGSGPPPHENMGQAQPIVPFLPQNKSVICVLLLSCPTGRNWGSERPWLSEITQPKSGVSGVLLEMLTCVHGMHWGLCCAWEGGWGAGEGGGCAFYGVRSRLWTRAS